MFYLIQDDNVPLSSIDKFFVDFSLEKANEILSSVDSPLISSTNEIPTYDEKLYINTSTKTICDNYFESHFFALSLLKLLVDLMIFQMNTILAVLIIQQKIN